MQTRKKITLEELTEMQERIKALKERLAANKENLDKHKMAMEYNLFVIRQSRAKE